MCYVLVLCDYVNVCACMNVCIACRCRCACACACVCVICVCACVHVHIGFVSPLWEGHVPGDSAWDPPLSSQGETL